MMERTMVTLIAEDSLFEKDLEVSCTMVLEELCIKILETLKKTDHSMFEGYEKIKLKLSSEEKTLDEKHTLEEEFVWDGSILTIVGDQQRRSSIGEDQH